MTKSFKLRAYPTKKQIQEIEKNFNCARFVFNYYLNKIENEYAENKKHMTFNQTCNDLTNLKNELVWLKEADKWALQNALRDLDQAYQFYFKCGKNTPKFKSKRCYEQSYRSTNSCNTLRVEGKKFRLPKVGLVKFRDKRVPEGRILNATVKRTKDGKYYIIVCCTDIDNDSLPKTGCCVGLDVGIKEFCITSDGEMISNPRYLKKSANKIARLQKSLSRKSSNSRNKQKARLKLAREYQKISNQRNDFLHKTTSRLVKEYDLICMENIKSGKLMKNHNLAASIADASWYQFKVQLTYKSDWYSKKLITIDRFFPSSQLCSNCGYRNSDVKNLKIRNWKCPECGAEHDRDINAAINILNEGLNSN